MNDVNFIIWAPDFNPAYGGIVALHKLAHNLALLGEKVYLFANRKNPKWLGTLLTPEVQTTITTDNTIVLYPEIVVGNPLNGKHVVRWILNTPGVAGGDGVFSDTDLIFKYQPYFSVDEKYSVAGLLTTFDVDFEVFADRQEAREGECYLVYKAKDKVLDQHHPEALCIDNLRGHFQALSDVFNRKEMFISYDHASFVSVQAALCGCVSVVIPDGVNSKERYRELFAAAKYGIAYGMDDLEWAKSTLHRVKENLTEIMEGDLQLTRKFVEICKGRMNFEDAPAAGGAEPQPIARNFNEIIINAFQLYDVGQLDRALSLCEQLLADGVGHFYLHYLAGSILFQQGKFPLAEPRLRAAMAAAEGMPPERVQDVVNRLQRIAETQA